MQILYLVLKLRHIQLQKVSFVSSLMQANVIHSILNAGSEGNSRACTANAMGAEHAPSATGIVVHVPMGWPCLLVQCRLSCYVAPHALST